MCNFAPKNGNMEENKRKRGRPATGRTTVDVHYKMSADLYNALPKSEPRNTYINNAVRAAMVRDGYLTE